MIDNSKCCPLCGHGLGARTTLWNPDHRTLLTAAGVSVELTYREALLFNVLWLKHPACVEGGPLLREVWGNHVYARFVDEKRTPDLVRTNIYRINKKLRGSGIRIELKGPNYGWRIAIDGSRQAT